ncbi:MAG: cell adhesion-like domain protein [Podoviridae sp. ctKoA10]|nr:MAG: cell adhesion-like domain protein [Podoviridae sp. ctKoA10]
MAFLRNPVVYVPDLLNGRPIVDGKVYVLAAGTIPPMHDSAIDSGDLVTVSYENEAGNIVEAPQPLYTSKGGCLYGNYPDSARQYMISPQEYVFAVYNRLGQYEYSGETFADDYVESAALAAADSTVLVGGVEAGEITKTIATVESTGGLARNIVVSVGENTIDPATQGSGIFGVGWETFPNKIGAVAKPVGTDGTNAAEWDIDSGYASATLNNASVATISGGYDHINNQIAGTICGGGHNFIQYNSGGHSFIGGGSYNWIQAGRSTILAGTNNRINGQVHNTIIGGLTNKILNGSYQFILSGKDNVINTTDDTTSISNAIIGRNNSITGVSKDNILLGRFQTSDANEGCAALGGTGHDISGSLKSVAVGGNEIDMTTTQYCGAVGGDNITMTGATYCFSGGGFGNTQTARSSAMIAAEDCTDNGARGLFTGRMAEGLGGIYQTVVGGRHPSYASGVKVQMMRVLQCETTTSATALNAPADQQIIVGNSLYTTITGTCFVTARNVTDSKSAGYKVDFVAQWDGTSYFLNGAASDLAMTVIYQNVSSNITAPTLAFSAGALRVRFGGTASKTVHWSAVLDFVIQRN